MEMSLPPGQATAQGFLGASSAPGGVLAGLVDVGEGAMIGVHATVLPRLKIGAWATVGGGAVVVRDVPEGAVVAGNPARELRRP